ncbi:Tip elongation aberrant protein 1 [Thelohanellus kitauei]|uniref:Tip elongation aberrant protein 1 n=1 Tax=Thelohanellus kitauei TaxID=669202 RepID=A0A0C2MA22_THEKT|nr:Tip elongation aberrant protein 1 [Thelohanellus kitauei]
MKLDNEIIAFENRIFHCVTSAGKFLIIFGGYNHCTETVCNELWTYDTINGVCTKYAALVKTAETCVNSTICAVGNQVYIFGGTGLRLRDGSTNSLISFDISNGTSHDLSPRIDDYSQYTPPPMYRSFVFYHNESLYIIGSIGEQDRMDTMNKYSIKTSTWFSVRQNGLKPVFRNRIFGTVFKNK